MSLGSDLNYCYSIILSSSHDVFLNGIISAGKPTLVSCEFFIRSIGSIDPMAMVSCKLLVLIIKTMAK